jgi:hypothetical protein
MIHRCLQSIVLFILFSTVTGCQTVPKQTERAADGVYFLHLYSNRYDIHRPVKDYTKDEDNECIATIAVASGVEFYANLPNHYEPEIKMEGKVLRRNDYFESAFTILVQDVGPTYFHKQNTPVPIDILVPLSHSDGEFHFAISRHADPYKLDVRIKK